ncbi:DNA ligase [Marinobacterium stanieri]|uniref:DNA ligase-1 n=1 Tax=Marinobacterium stanieri TaxID=49186 RepID=A0A1N6WLF1_9GAMM|nr:DNA ligase [Marinobacterium stanieri]SIQ90901.1 DNA ligase-1 [Marinobacterium stanieri]
MLKYPALILAGLVAVPAQADAELTLMHGMEIGDQLSQPEDLANWLVSEKFDGVRAYWNGQQLLTRSGYPIHTPPGFTDGWPGQHLEGELWIGYGQFSRLSGLVQRYDTQPDDWHDVRFMVFDLPQWPDTFTGRQQRLQQLLKSHPVPLNLKLVPQYSGLDEAALQARLQQVLAKGGEGLMLHRANALYQVQRTADIRKLKPFQDADAKVLAHLPGKGKYVGMLGSVQVELEDGTRLRIGSGFSDTERADPPPIGSTITFRYNGLTRHGKPRFARFLRIRPD